MGKFLSFFVGFLTCLLVLGAAGFWFFTRTTADDSSKKPLALKLPSGGGIGPATNAPAGDQDLPRVGFKGKIQPSPQVQELLAKAKTISVRLNANGFQGGLGTGDFGGQRFESPAWPLTYTINWSDEAKKSRMGPDDLGVAMVTAIICLDTVGNVCGQNYTPRLEGRVRSPLFVKGGLPRGAGKEMYFNMDEIVVNRILSDGEPAECVKGGYQLSGQVQPTAAFVAAAADRKKVVLVRTPNGLGRLGATVVGPNARRPTTQEMKELVASGTGVDFQALTLNGQQPLPFSMKVPAGMERQLFNFFAVLCAKDEADADCATKVFPMPDELDATIAKRDWYRLVPKGFNLPYCGRKNVVLFLHQFQLPAGKATLESYRAAGQQPELTDGISY